MTYRSRTRFGWLTTLLLFSLPVAQADDISDLTQLLNQFLAGASIGDKTIHQSFWAEELVYTSSAGERTNREAILSSMPNTPPKASEPPAVVYSARDTDIRIYDDIAIVAFELVGTPSDPSAQTMRYLNTGTFIKRDDNWQAIAWQATKKADAE